MPKYWGKQIFTHGRFPEVGQKQKTKRKREKILKGLRVAEAAVTNFHTREIPRSGSKAKDREKREKREGKKV